SSDGARRSLAGTGFPEPGNQGLAGPGIAMVAAAPSNEVGHALRVAWAAVVCLLLVEWWHLEYGALAVLTTHMVLAQYAFTAFQKGARRLAGRGLRILL